MERISKCSVQLPMRGYNTLLFHGRQKKRKPLSLGACLPGGGGPQIGDVTCGGSPHLSCKRDQIKMRDYMDRRVTLPKRVTSPTWGPPPPCSTGPQFEMHTPQEYVICEYKRGVRNTIAFPSGRGTENLLRAVSLHTTSLYK